MLRRPFGPENLIASTPSMTDKRIVRAPRGTEMSCKGWHQEAALRMLMNNLDPEVAEAPDRLIVYGGTGRAARNWECLDAIVRSLSGVVNDEDMILLYGTAVGKLRTQQESSR